MTQVTSNSSNILKLLLVSFILSACLPSSKEKSSVPPMDTPSNATPISFQPQSASREAEIVLDETLQKVLEAYGTRSAAKETLR